MITELQQWLRHISFLIKKEILTIVKEPANRVILIVPVFLQALLFGYAATYDVNHVDYAVLDQSRGQTSTQILSHLDGTGVFTRRATLTSASQIEKVVMDGKVLMVLTFPSDFESKLTQGQTSPLQVILDGRNSSTAGAAAGYISAVVSDFNQRRAKNFSPINVDVRAWYNPNLESRWGLMPTLIAAISMMQTLLLSALSVAREREQGTFDQLLVTPFTPMQLLIGKAIPPILVGLVQSTIILMVILFWFQIPMNGSVWLLYFGLFSFNIAAVGLGLSISAVSINMQQAMLYTFLLIMPLMLLSGLLTPVQTMPPVLDALTYANPLRFAIDLVRRVYLEGAGFSYVAVDFIPMIGMTIITMPLAAWLFRNRLY